LFYLYLRCYYFINWVGMNLHSLVIMLLIKLDPLKCLTALNLSHPPYGLACHVVFLLLSTTRAQACLFPCIYNTRFAAQTGRTLKTTTVISRSSRCACLQSAACGGTLSAARTCYVCFVEDYCPVITLYSCGTVFGIHHVVACV
jgi:hypothetical protein